MMADVIPRAPRASLLGPKILSVILLLEMTALFPHHLRIPPHFSADFLVFSLFCRPHISPRF